MRILVVEDDAVILLALNAALYKLGHETTTAHNGVVAKQYLESNIKFDLLLTDIRLPRPDGVELAHLIRAISPRTALLFMSGYSMPEPMTLKGPYRLMRKPYLYDRMDQEVRQSVQEHADWIAAGLPDLPIQKTGSTNRPV